jgi:hypothetical protein
MAKKETAVEVINVGYSSGASAVFTLNTATAIYSDSFYLGDASLGTNINSPINVGVTFASGVQGSVNVICFLEQSWRRPVVEGSFDATYVSASYNTVNHSAVGTWSYAALNTAAASVLLPYGRFRVQGATINTSSTVSLVLSKKVSG